MMSTRIIKIKTIRMMMTLEMMTRMLSGTNNKMMALKISKIRRKAKATTNKTNKLRQRMSQKPPSKNKLTVTNQKMPQPLKTTN